MGKTHVSKTLHCWGNSFKYNSLKQEAHITPTHVLACFSCMHTTISRGSGSHRQLFHPYRSSPLYGIGSKNRENLCLKDPLLWWAGSVKHSFKHQLHTTHVGTIGWKPSTAVFPPHIQGSRIMGWCMCALNCFKFVL